jgi:hypothetical protein
MTTYIIIGNGVAGNAAAESLRKYDKRGKIVIFAKEQFPFYYVPALPEFLAGEKDLSGLIIHNLDWYDKNQIELHLETAIAGMTGCCWPPAAIPLSRPLRAPTRQGSLPCGPWRMPGSLRNLPARPARPSSSAAVSWASKPATACARPV